MQSTYKGWVSLKSAAKTLGCSEAVVKELADRAVIRRLTDGDKIFVRSDDVEEVRSIQGGVRMHPDETARRLILLERQVSRLQEALDLLLEVNSLSGTRLEPMSDAALISLYDSIDDAAKAEAWTLQRILSCCEVFIRISDDEMDRVSALADTKTPWLPFYELCLKQLRYVTTHPDFSTDINLQRCRDLLARGRTNLRSIAVISIEINATQKTSQQMLARLAVADVEEFDAIFKQFRERGEHSNRLL